MSKIVHVCIAANYVPGMNYQENILPRKHKEMGYDVEIVTTPYQFNSDYVSEERKVGSFVNEDGIKVTVLPYRKTQRAKNYRIMDGLYEYLENRLPDIIFCHGTQFESVFDVIRFCRKNPSTRLFADQHGDYYNSGLMVNSRIKYWRRYLLQKYYYGFLARSAAKYAECIWGVTPIRQKFLQDVYGVPVEKTGLLVMGGDEKKVEYAKREEIRHSVRNELQIDADDFVIITGGKIDLAKNVHYLMRAVSELKTDHVKLLVCGSILDDVITEIQPYRNNKNIIMLGWIKAEYVCRYFHAADLAVFPGTHSVLWEEACACGIPGVFKRWDGMEHVDVGGNAIFIQGDNVEELREILAELSTRNDRFAKMKAAAQGEARLAFSYGEIARRSIERRKRME